MKIVVFGGTGRIGARLVANLRQEDCRVYRASRCDGIDLVTGAGLTRVLEGAEVVIDVSGPSTLTGMGPLRFFEASSRNLVATGRSAGVKHHIALSIVGVDRLSDIDYFRAKMLQEAMIAGSGLGFTIVRSTQFFEFVRDVVQDGTARDIPIAPARVQPIAAQDVANALADMTFTEPRGGPIEIAGPEQMRLDDVASEIATAFEDNRRVVADPHARYFGALLEERSLLPGPHAFLGTLRFDDWLRHSLQPARVAHLPPSGTV